MSGYTHSRVFAKVKRHQESIQGNLTTSQYLGILDSMLTPAVEHLVAVTNGFEGFVLQVLGWQERHLKRRVSFLDKTEFRDKALEFLAGRLDWKQLKLDRLLLFQYLEQTINQLKPTLLSHDNTRLVEERHPSITAATPFFLDSLRSAIYWSEEATRFRGQILEKYYRLCLVTARRDYTQHFNTEVSLDEIVQAYIEAACRAIDRCDPEQGVLTTLVQYWLMTARNSLTKNLRNPLPSTSVPLDQISTVLSDDDDDDSLDPKEAARIRDLLAIVDVDGLARAFLGIDESVPHLLHRYPHDHELLLPPRLPDVAPLPSELVQRVG